MLRDFAIVATAFEVDVIEAGLRGADSTVMALSIATGVTKAVRVMAGTPLVARLIGLDNPRSAMAYGGRMGTVSGVAGGLAAIDPKLESYGALTATFHTGIGCLVGPLLLFLIVRGLGGVMRMGEGNAMDGMAEGRGLLSDQIRNALTDEIASGVLAAGIALDEQDLADRFGASRTPVREALRQLASSGLVEMRPRRGVVVTRMTPERIMEMFETTAEFEALCVRLATYRMTPLELSALMDLHEQSAEPVAAQDYDTYDALNRAFHEALYRGTHNGFMAEQALAIRSRLSAFRRTQLRQGERILRSRAEHGEILQAIAEGDGDAAARRMRAHMLNAASALGRYVADHASD